MTKCLEDFSAGQEWSTGGRTITESHVVTFAGISGDFFPLHVDAAFAAKSKYGQRVVQGPLVYAIAVGLVSQCEGIFGGAVLAFMGASNMRHHRPVFIDTTVYVRLRVLDVRHSSSNPTQGVCTFRYDVIDTQGQTVMEADMLFLMPSRQSRDVGDA